MTQKGYFWKPGPRRLPSIPWVWKRTWDDVALTNFCSMSGCTDEWMGLQAAALEVVNVSPEQLGQLGLESFFCHLPAGWPL